MKHLARLSMMCRRLAVAGAAALLLAPALPASEGAEDLVSLRWALGALETEDAASPSAIKKDTQLDTGTRLKFLLEPMSKASVYLILLDSSSEIHVLYRQPLSADDADKTYIPPGSQWFELDDSAGMETFFLLASADPLDDLESLLTRHASADGAARSTLGTEIVQEIRRLHKANRNFARPVEKPVMIGGQTRAAGDGGIDQLAVEISAEKFYGKTITIDH